MPQNGRPAFGGPFLIKPGQWVRRVISAPMQGNEPKPGRPDPALELEPTPRARTLQLWVLNVRDSLNVTCEVGRTESEVFRDGSNQLSGAPWSMEVDTARDLAMTTLVW